MPGIPTDDQFCTVRGAVFLGRQPVECATVTLELDCPPSGDFDYEISMRFLITHTNSEGAWSADLLRGARYRITLRAAGLYDCPIEIPDEVETTLQQLLGSN